MRELRRVDGLAEAYVLGIRGDGHVEEPVPNRERAVRRDRGVVVALLDRNLSGREKAPRLVGEQREHGIVEGDVDAPTLARSSTLYERGEGRLRSRTTLRLLRFTERK